MSAAVAVLVTPLPRLSLNAWTSVLTVLATAALPAAAVARSFLDAAFGSVVQSMWLSTCGPLAAIPAWASVPIE